MNHPSSAAEKNTSNILAVETHLYAIQAQKEKPSTKEDTEKLVKGGRA